MTNIGRHPLFPFSPLFPCPSKSRAKAAIASSRVVAKRLFAAQGAVQKMIITRARAGGRSVGWLVSIKSRKANGD
jgi:hypothetical protein